MKFKRLVKNALRPIATPLLNAIATRVSNRTRRVSVEETVEFELRLLATLRSLTTRSDHRVLLPYDSARPHRKLNEIKIGFFGNIANNAYNFTRCLRRLGYDAELVVEDGGLDAFLLDRPFWEDMEVECSTYEDGLAYEHEWRQANYVRRVAYDVHMQKRFQARSSTVPEVQAMYRDAFGVDLPSDRALLLAQQMGHWPYLLAMKRYDVVQFSGAAISMGAFCPKPYVVFPTGSDLFVSPFQETVFGLLMRGGYLNARHLFLGEANFFEYIDRLTLHVPRTFAPLMVDTDVYTVGESSEVRAQWIKMIGGKRFILSVCRQSWEWKGNDRLIRAFSALLTTPHHRDWRLVLMQWGPDVEKTKKLIAELRVADKIFWQKLASKPLLRRLQQAADLVADQFVMPGYGTSVLESMAASKAVVMRPADERIKAYLKEPPPVMGASQPEEICAQLENACNDRLRGDIGQESLKWVRSHHGYLSVFKVYIDGYASALPFSMWSHTDGPR